jgi:hypothetical protein
MSKSARKPTEEKAQEQAGTGLAPTDTGLEAGLSLTTDEITARFRAGVQEAVAKHLAAGRPVYGADEQGRLYALLPDRSRVYITSWRDSPPHTAAKSELP